MDLFPNELYFLKWRSLNQNGQIRNMIVLKAEFIKPFNATYCEEFRRYRRHYGVNAPPANLVGTILMAPERVGENEVEAVDEEELIPYPFADPLYPYRRFGTFGSCNMGLFRIISLKTSVYLGINQPFRNNNPYNFVTLRANTIINTPEINYGETLMWVDLDRVQIREAFDEKIRLYEQEISSLQEIPEDVKRHVIGPLTRRNLRLGGNRNRNHNRNKKSRVGKSNRNRKSRRSRSV